LKIYYLHLKNIDFTVSGSDWVSGVIDLYDNASIASMATPSYVNYSTTKSPYGTNLLGDNTWTGFNVLGNSASPNTVTESGYMKNGSFVDTTGRIDITSWEISINNFSKENVTPYITVYNNDNKNLSFPNEWYGINRISENKSISIPEAPRYAKFVLNFDTNLNVSNIQFDLYVRIRVGKPVISPLYSRTQTVMRKFPEWMELRKDGDAPATPSLATPTTVAGSFVNAIAGEWLDGIVKDISTVQLQRFVESADTGQIAWAYVVSGIPDIIVKVFGDSVELKRAHDVLEFTDSLSTEDIFYWDEFDNTIYTRKFYNNFNIDGTQYTLTLSQVWNWFDEHGLAVDLARLTGENNDSFRKRIIDVYKNKPGVGIESFKLALRRELNLWSYWGATPDSEYLGATPEVLEIKDIFTDSTYVNPDGMPTDKLSDLVESLSEKYPTTWGYFRWDHAYWDIDGEDSEGYIVIPNRFDAEKLPDENIQSGVGDDLDLYIYSPDVKTNQKTFTLTATARGLSKDNITQEYAPVGFDIELYGRASKAIYSNPEVSVWLSLRLLMKDGKEYRANYEVTNTSGVDHGVATPNTGSFTNIPLIEIDKMYPDLNWYDTSLQQYIDKRITSEFIKEIDINGRKVFAFPRGSVVDSGSPSLVSGNTVTLRNGSSWILGTIDEILQKYSIDEEDQGFYDFIVLSPIETFGDITADNWTIPNYIYVYGEESTPTFLASSLTVEYGKYDFTPNNVITSSTSYLEVDSTDPNNPIYYRYFSFSEDTVNPSTPNLVVGQEIVLHREDALIVGTIISLNESYLGNSAVDALKVRIKSISGEPMDTVNVSNWSIFSPSMKGITEFPTSNVGMYLSDNVKFGVQSTELKVNSATPSYSKLTTDLTNHPSIMVFSYETSLVSNTKWESDHFPYSVIVNSLNDISAQNAWTTVAPEILWDKYLSATPNMEILVEIKTSNNSIFCGVATGSAGEIVYIPKENIYVNGFNNWVQKFTYDSTPTGSYVISLPATTGSISITVNASGLANYPIQRQQYNPFTETINIGSVTVDENGPWIGGIKPVPGSNNYNYNTLSLSRDSFGIDNTTDFIVTWIGVGANDDEVITWLDQNSVKSAVGSWVDQGTSASRIEERLGLDGKYYFDPFMVKVKLKSGINPQWNPNIHSGWFYDKDEEYYLYISEVNETSEGLSGATYNHHYTESVARQGAPIIVEQVTAATPVQLRQVSFFDENINLTLTNTQRMYGNGTSNLYLAYPDIYDATVSDVTSGDILVTNSYSSTNALPVATPHYPVQQSLTMPGSSGNHISTPDKASIPSGSQPLDVRVRLAPNQWKNTGIQYIAAQNSGAAASSSFALYTQGDKLYAVIYGTIVFTGFVGSSISACPLSLSQIFSDKTPVWIRFTWNLDFFGLPSVSFYQSSDGISWESIGVVSNAIASISGSTTAVTLGTLGSLSSLNRFVGKLYNFEMYSGTSRIMSFDGNDIPNKNSSTFTSSKTGETWTIARTVNTSSNQSVVLNTPNYVDTNPEHIYEISYKLRKSFYVDNDYIDEAGNNRSKFVFDRPSSEFDQYTITYESSKFEESKTIELPLNPFYTVQDEGFVYLSHNEYDSDKPIVKINPGKILSDGIDYAMVSIYSVDINGNPKPSQDFFVQTNFGIFQESGTAGANVTTDADGFCLLTLISEIGASSNSGTIFVSDLVNPAFEYTFEIDIRPEAKRKLYAIVSPDAIPADGISATSVTGKVLDIDDNPVPYAYVSYRRGRSVYEVFTDEKPIIDVGLNATPASTPYWPDRGRVTSNASGVFNIGPFTAATPDHSGYWFLSTESSGVNRKCLWANMPGTSGNQITTSDPLLMPVNASPSRGGILDIRIKVAPDKWKPSAIQYLVTQFSGATATSLFRASLNTTGFFAVQLFGLTSSGTVTNATKTGTLDLSTYFTDGSPGWLRFVYDNTATTPTVILYYSRDGISWYAPTAATNSTIHYLNASSADIVLGANTAAGAGSRFVGKFYNLEIYSGSTQTPVLNFDINDATYNSAGLLALGAGVFDSSKTGETWTITSDGSLTLQPADNCNTDDDLLQGYEAIGDVVYWQEYPPRTSEVHGSNSSIRTPINKSKSDKIWKDSLGNIRIDPAVPHPATVNQYPITYDEATPTDGATPVTNNWSPPIWYAVRSYDQYQRGLIGNDFYAFDINRLNSLHPDYRDI
jgi:hypothetical protein